MLRFGVLAMAIWLAGLFIGIPVAIYDLLFRAEREHYALLITFIIGWPFFYWPTVGPLLLAWRVYALYRKIVSTTSRTEFLNKIEDDESQDVIVALMAQENRIPRWLARRLYRFMLRRAAGYNSPEDVYTPTSTRPTQEEPPSD